MNSHLTFSAQSTQRPVANSVITTEKPKSAITDLNRSIFRTIVLAQLRGSAAIPYGLGLDACVYRQLLKTINDPLISLLDERWFQPEYRALRHRSDTIKELTKLRISERNALVDLLFQASHIAVPNAVHAAIVVATACLSPSHLWKTLGLENRQQLRTY